MASTEYRLYKMVIKRPLIKQQLTVRSNFESIIF